MLSSFLIQTLSLIDGVFCSDMLSFLKKEKIIAGILIAIGIFLRLHQYLENRSFWLDEAYAALDITVRSFQQILYAIPFCSDLPVPPIGFSLIEKFFINLFSNNEYAFRLFPFFSGIISLPLFYAFLNRYASKANRLLALGLFVFSDSLIYYSAELKPYSSDVLIALTAYLFAYSFDSKPLNLYRLFVFSLMGVIAIFFSHPSIFVLAGVGFAQLLFSFLNNDKKRIRWLLFAYYLWALNFFIQYFVSLKGLINNSSLINGAKAIGFLPDVSMWSWAGMSWFLNRLSNIFANPMGILPPILGAGLFLWGMKAVWKNSRRQFFYIVLPTAFVLTAILFEKYIFAGRLLLFCVPAFLLCISEGAVAVTAHLKNKRLAKALTIFLFAALLLPSLKTAVHYLVYPRGKSEMRPVMEYFKKYQQEGDVIYYNNSAQYAFGYYLGYFHSDCSLSTMGKFSDELSSGVGGTPGIFLQYDYYQCTEGGYRYGVKKGERLFQINAENFKEMLNHPRTWILFSHFREEYKQKMLQIFRTQGEQLQGYEREGASIYLFDFSRGQTKG